MILSQLYKGKDHYILVSLSFNIYFRFNFFKNLQEKGYKCPEYKAPLGMNGLTSGLEHQDF